MGDTTSTILDEFGYPMMKADLQDEIAGPSLTGTRSIVTGQPTFDMKPMRMARLMLEADTGNVVSYLEMAEQIEEKDCHYQSILGTRKRAVAQMEICVDPASQDPVDLDNAQFIRNWLNRDDLESEIFDMLDAIGKGYSLTEIIWDFSESQWDIAALKWRDPRWFIFDRVTGNVPLLLDEGQYKQLPPNKFIYHQHKAKSGLPIKGGVVRPCAWMWMFKNFGIKDWVIFSEAYGQPIRLGKYAPGTSAEDRAVLKRAIASMGSDVGAIIPDSMVVELIESAQKAGSTDMFQSKSDWFDRQMSKAVLGQTTTTDAQGNGIAGNQAHAEVRSDIGRADARQLAASLNKQLVIPYIDLNKGPQKKYPRITIGRTEDVDITAIANTADKIVRLGAKVSGKKLVEMVGLPAPEDDEDALQPAAPAMPPQDTGDEDGDENLPAAAPAVKPKPNTASAATPPKPDAIAASADQMSQDWEEVMNPVIAMLEGAVKDASSYEEFSEKLLEIASQLPVDVVKDKVARAVFMARVAGNINAKLED